MRISDWSSDVCSSDLAGCAWRAERCNAFHPRLMASIRERCETRLQGMKAIRQDYEPDWKEIARFAQLARSRFLNSETNKNRSQRNGKMYDEYGVTSYRTLAGGMTPDLSSPSRPGFTLATYDEIGSASCRERVWQYV